MQMGPQRSSSMPMILGIVGVGVLLVLCCGGAAGYFVMARGASSVPPAIPPMPDPVPTSSAGPQVAPDPLVAPAPTAATDSSINATMTVTAATGLATIAPGTRCPFVVTHRDGSDGLNCQAHVTCNGVALYGNTQSNGFFPCPVFSTTPPSLSGGDTQTTSADQDPSFVIDSTSGTVTIADDASGANGAFSVTGTIQLQ